MKTLLHLCCAPCSIACVDVLQEEGISVTEYWYNPTIHPFTEYRNRRNAAIEYAKNIGIPLVVEDEYGLREFIRNVSPDFDHRCGYCYAVRLRRTAQYAAENGFDHFTTSLLISPYQNHEMIIETAEKAAEEYGTNFLYRDFRPLFREGQTRAREAGLYMQKYCGCIFSEEDRYLKKKK
ncbi:MAG: epoxyqueuosine reductase QueH [Christensenella sp.]|nr:epoxyqueuosine reductase QueH [Christensenella sp.]